MNNVKLYSQRGGRLIWMTHKDELAKHGFGPGARFDVELTSGKIVLRSNPDGRRKVSDKKGKPVLCVIGKGITQALGFESNGVIDMLKATAKDGVITLTK